MKTYKFTSLENGDILLQKVIIDNTKYTIIYKDNGDKLLKTNNIIDKDTLQDIKKYDFKKSIITQFSIGNVINNSVKLKYKSILEEIYKIIKDGAKIIKNTILNIKTLKKEDEGYYYLDNIGISVQGVNSNKCLVEIINQCIKNQIKLFMKIKIKDNIDININI